MNREDGYQKYLKEKRERETREAESKDNRYLFDGTLGKAPEASPEDRATERFLEAISQLPNVEQFVVMAYYGVNYPRLNARQMKARIKETLDLKLTSIDLGVRRIHAIWYIAGALHADPKKVREALDDHRARTMEQERTGGAEAEQIAEMRSKDDSEAEESA